MTSENPDTPQQPDCKSKTFYLKEALRLSELKIEQQSRTFDIIEKKAVLLLTLYIATIAYLLSRDIWDEENGITTIASIAIFILAISILIGLPALKPRKVGIPGAHPEYLIYFKYDFNAMAMHLLKEEYNSIYATNKEAIRKKRNYLKISFRLGLATFVFAPLLAIIIPLLI